MRISDWSSDVCSSDLSAATRVLVTFGDSITEGAGATPGKAMSWPAQLGRMLVADPRGRCWAVANQGISGNRLLSSGRGPNALSRFRSEEHTSELQSLMRISYAVFCLKKKKTHVSHNQNEKQHTTQHIDTMLK